MRKVVEAHAEIVLDIWQEYRTNTVMRLMLQSHAIERPEDAMKARGLIGRNLG
jgi:hypothetical protein